MPVTGQTNRMPDTALQTPTRRGALGLMGAGAAGLFCPQAFAQAEEFYRGKTINIVVGFPPAGSYDAYARVLATHLPRHIPGNPTIVTRNMPGAGSVTAAAFLYAGAPKDGLSIGVIAPTLPLDERLGIIKAQMKSSELGWIGRVNPLVNVIFVRANSIGSAQEAMKTSVRLAATGTGSAVTIYPSVMNKVLGAKFDLVLGYQGSAECMLAVDRGEADGHCTGWDTLKTSHPDWLTEKKIRLLTQFAVNRHQELPDVPTVMELATTDRQKATIRAVVNAAESGTSFITTPNAPPERLMALRMAFNACMKDPAFIADLKKMNFGLNPLSGEAVGALVSDVSMVSEDLLPDLRDAYSLQPGR